MKTNFDTLAELPASSDARQGFDVIASHLGKGKLVQSTGLIETASGDLLAPALARLRDTVASFRDRRAWLGAPASSRRRRRQGARRLPALDPAGHDRRRFASGRTPQPRGRAPPRSKALLVPSLPDGPELSAAST